MFQPRLNSATGWLTMQPAILSIHRCIYVATHPTSNFNYPYPYRRGDRPDPLNKVWRKTLEFCFNWYSFSPKRMQSEQLIAVSLQADKAAQSAGGGFSLFGGKTEKYEKAAELYTQAANAFRVQKQGAESLCNLVSTPYFFSLQQPVNKIFLKPELFRQRSRLSL